MAYCLHHPSAGSLEDSLFSPAFSVKALLFFSFFFPPAMCHIPLSSQLCALFLEEHSGNLAEQCAGVASSLPCDLVGC